MKLIIAGSREFRVQDEPVMLVNFAVKWFGLLTKIDEVVSGGAEGIDQAGEMWAKKLNIPIKSFKPDWGAYGKAAGPIRNEAMAMHADALLCIWNGKSRGSANMLQHARMQNLPTYEIIMRERHDDQALLPTM